MSNSDNAERAKHAAMEQVEENANQIWIEFMLDLVWDIARVRRQFTTDDVYALYYSLPGWKPETHEHRAMGPVMGKAAKEGICAKANVVGKPSNRTSRHAAPLTVWNSLIYEGQQ